VLLLFQDWASQPRNSILRRRRYVCFRVQSGHPCDHMDFSDHLPAAPGSQLAYAAWQQP
jgi:hypothetical protein